MRLHMKWWHPLAAITAAAALLLTPTPSIFASSGEPEPPPVLIIDAGHGGADGGAVAPDGTLESDINLDIALRLEALAAFWGVQTVMTRSAETIDYPDSALTLAAMKKADQDERIAVINAVPNGVLVSVHQNNYSAPQPSGIQVFYGTEPGGGELAAVMQDNLTANLCPENRRVAAPIDEGIYLMRHAACPAVLVECGFLSNPGELRKLETEEYRTQLAVVMLASYMQYTQDAAVRTAPVREA